MFVRSESIDNKSKLVDLRSTLFCNSSATGNIFAKSKDLCKDILSASVLDHISELTDAATDADEVQTSLVSIVL